MCPSIGMAQAAKTRGGAHDGPGPINVLRGKFNGIDKLSGGGTSNLNEDIIV